MNGSCILQDNVTMLRYSKTRGNTAMRNCRVSSNVWKECLKTEFETALSM